MATCFICNDKLFKERKCMSTSVTEYSKVSYPEKIVELLGEEFVIILTPSDYLCNKCASLLNHMDKLENDLKLVKSTLLSSIQKKFGLLPTVPPVKSINVDNDRLIPEGKLQVSKKKVSSRYKAALTNNSIDVDNDRLIPKGELQVSKKKVASRYKAALTNNSIDVDNDRLIPEGELQVDQNEVSSRYKAALTNNSMNIDNDRLIPKGELQVPKKKVASRYKAALTNNSIDVDNDRLIPEGELQVDQNEVSSRYKAALTNNSMDVDNDRLIPEGELQVDQNKVPRGYKDVQKKFVRTTSQKIKSKITLYRCAFCPLESKEIGFVRTHMQSHKKEITKEKPKQIVTQPSRKLQQNKTLYRCDLCVLYFETKSACLSHIHKSHKRIHTSLITETIKEGKTASSTIKPAETPMITEENCNMLLNIEDKGEEDNLMDIDALLLNNYLSANEIENMSFLNITGNVNAVQYLPENDENASGHDQDLVGIAIESLFAALHEN